MERGYSSNEIILNNKIKGNKKSYECKLICDVVHLEGAEELAKFEKDYYKGYVSITENKYGKGKAVYVATEPEEELIQLLIKHYCDEKSIKGILKSKDGIEVTKRTIIMNIRRYLKVIFNIEVSL